jgi:hypothetical protein
MGISFGISIAASLLLPFPISLITIIGVFILLNFCMRNRMMKKMGIGMGGGGAGGRMSGSSSSSMFEDTSLKFYCMSCGMQHKQAVCPKCSSKMK